ncbi:BOLA class I histocompatibility antigen, alpha chain BL3-7-like isoform X1, partial [Clarias magur]
DHTMQWMYGCQLHDDGTTGGNDLYSYDGTDFLYLDMSTPSWHAANKKAELFKNKWDTTGEEATHMRKYLDNQCINSLKEYVSLLSRLQSSQRKVPPEVSVFQKHSSSPEVVCHTTGFFSKPLNMTWQKDGEDVREDVELRETLPNQDGSFQKRSILRVPAEELKKHNYTCVVQHSSLEKELVKLVPPESQVPR